MLAVKRSDKRVVSALLADPRLDPNWIDQLGHTAVMWAIREEAEYRDGTYDIAAEIVACERTDINQSPIHGSTLLHVSACNGASRILSMLLRDPRLNLSINAQMVDPSNGATSTPLMLASQFANAKCVRLLLCESCTDVNFTTNAEFYNRTAPDSNHLPYVYDKLTSWPACTDGVMSPTGSSRRR